MITAPVVAVGVETELREVAWLLTAYRIKRLPIPRDDRIVGIVSRADLVRALAEAQMEPTPPAASEPWQEQYLKRSTWVLFD